MITIKNEYWLETTE